MLPTPRTSHPARKRTFNKYWQTLYVLTFPTPRLYQESVTNPLSPDGGGLRGLSILYILSGLMAKVNEHQDPLLNSCEAFELIAEPSTRGQVYNISEIYTLPSKY